MREREGLRDITGNVQLYLPEAGSGRTLALTRMAAPLGGFVARVKDSSGRFASMPAVLAGLSRT